MLEHLYFIIHLTHGDGLIIAIKILKIPSIELHISNIYGREEFRQKSLLSKAVTGIICGLGTNGYIMALDAIIKLIKKDK